MSHISNFPKISLVGAGPGDPDLISIKGARTLATAKVILSDTTVNPALLAYTRKSAVTLFTEKLQRQYRYSQADIHILMVRFALTHGHVVRLAGGDPFLFERGHEALEFAAQYGIETAYVPGISSMTSLPGLQGIPLTRHGYADRFWVGTLAPQQVRFSKDLRAAARSGATVVLHVRMQHLPEISALYMDLSRGDTPAAIIQPGTSPDARYGLGRADQLVAIAERHALTSPGIVMLGEVVRLHPQWATREVALTRTWKGDSA